jgi:hypothetical protein
MSKKLIFTTTIGFSSPEEQLIETKLFDENDDIVSLRCEQPSELLEVSGSDATILLTKMIQLRGDKSLILSKLQSFVEATIKAGKSTTLVVIIKDYFGSDAKELVNQIIDEAYSLLPSSLRNKDHLSPLDLINVRHCPAEHFAKSSFKRLLYLIGDSEER